MSFFSNIKLISDYLNISSNELIQFEPTYHSVAQSFGKWPIVINDDGYKIKLFEWGLIADYMNTPEKIKEFRNSMANARSEKFSDDKKSVWYRIRKQKCLMFTTGFFEHNDSGLKKKIPYFIQSNEEDLLCFAGLYNYSPIPDIETGEAIGTFTILTRPANSKLGIIHNSGLNNNRMPLILTKDLANKWLDKNSTDEDISNIVRYEYPSTKIIAWPVNTIRTRKIDDENVIKEVFYENISKL